MTPTARLSDPALTALTADRLGEAWPEVSARLRKMLASRGVDPSLNDDIVQEVAVRALDKQVPFTDPADLYRWAATTARHLHIDHIRSDGRTTQDDALALLADGTDVAHAAERRVALGHVLRAMAGLRPGERAAILDSLEDREARTSQALVRRHRARATLRKAVGGAIATSFLARLRLRAVTPALRNAAAAAALAPALVVGAGSVLPQPADDAAAPERTVTLTAPRERAVPRPVARRARGNDAAVTPARRVATSGTAAARGATDEPPAPAPNRKTELGPLTHEPKPKDDSNRGKLACVRHGTRTAVCVDHLPPPDPVP